MNAPASAEPAIELCGIRFSYDGKTNAIDGATLAFAQGSLTCIVGGNGSGKSTLALLACGLLQPDAGVVRVRKSGSDGAESTGRRETAIVFQNPDDQLVASLVEDDVAFGPENLGVAVAELRARVTDALSAVGLAGFERREIASLSGGQKQLVALAGALALRPGILVLDEATSMLDPAGRNRIMRVCERLRRKGIAVIMITQIASEAARADRVIVLDAGRVRFDGTPDDVLCRNDDLRALGIETPFAARLSHELANRGVPVAGRASDDDLEEQLCLLHSRT